MDIDLNTLLKYAAEKHSLPRGTDEKNIQEYIKKNFSKNQEDLLKKLVSDKSAAENFLKSQKVQELLKKIENTGK